MGAPAPDPLSDLSPRSRADLVDAPVNPSKGPRLGTPVLCFGAVAVVVTASGGVVDVVDAVDDAVEGRYCFLE